MSPEIESLLADDGWIRRLARRLVRDPDAADDLIQDAWVSALSAPRPIRSPQQWFRGVLRNSSRDRRRREARRAEREREVARHERTPPTDEIVSEIALRQALFDALQRLDAPQRRALVLRFLHGRSLKAIAKEEGVAVSTVHGRIERGLAHLRARLDESHGGNRSAWVVGLLPLAKPAGGVTSFGPIALGGALVSSAWKALVPALLIAGAVGVFATRDAGDASPPRGPATTRATPAVADAPPAQVERPEAVSVRTEIPVSDTAPPTVADASATPRRRGRVVDPTGLGLPGVTVRFELDDAPEEGAARFEVASGPGGEFLLAAPSDAEGTFHVVDAVHRLVTSGSVDGVDLLVAAPVRRYAGLVLDPAGAPVPGADVEVRLRYSLYRELGLARTVGSVDRTWSQRTDASGRFAFDEAVGGTFAVLHAAHDAFVGVYADLPDRDALDLVVTLGRPDASHPLRGIVVDPSGLPLEGASVSLGSDIVETDADGAFELLWDPAGVDPFADDATGEAATAGPSVARLTALHPDYRPVRRDVTARNAGELFLLQLTGPPLAIEGSVRGPGGDPLEGLLVWIQDPTPFGRVDYGQGEETALIRMTAEEALRGGFSTRGVYTDDAGRFRLEKLFDRRYRVQVIDPRTATLGRGWEIEAGRRGVRLVLDPDPSLARVAGRVLSGKGEPLAGIELRVNRDGFFEDYHAMPPKEGPPVVTGPDGTFVFEELAVAGTRLRLDGEGLFFHYVTLSEEPGPLDALELIAPRLGELRVVLESDPTLADHFEVQDDQGEPVRILESFGSFLTDGTSGRIVEGRSGVLQVEEHGRTLVLYREGEEVHRVGVDLGPAQRAEIHL